MLDFALPQSRFILGGRRWHPGKLFGAGAVGACFDPSDLGTLFQDAAGTTPVTGPGDPVGLILDKSGGGHHASQSVNDDYRPTLVQDGTGKYGLQFDGVDDYLVTSAIDLTGTDKVGVFAGASSDFASTEIIAEFSASSPSNDGSFALYTTTSNTNWRHGGSSRVVISQGGQTTSKRVFTGLGDISNDVIVLRLDGQQAATSASDQGTGLLGNHPLYLGMRGGNSFPFSGILYGLTVLGRYPSDAEIARAERWTANKSGVTL